MVFSGGGCEVPSFWIKTEMRHIKVKCRYGVEYRVVSTGNDKKNAQLKRELGRCCCYVCENDDCDDIKEDSVKEKCSERLCEYYTNRPYCEQ